MNRTPAAGASLLLNLEGVFTALLAWFVFHGNVDRRIALGMLAIVAGTAVLGWQGYASWGRRARTSGHRQRLRRALVAI